MEGTDLSDKWRMLLRGFRHGLGQPKGSIAWSLARHSREQSSQCLYACFSASSRESLASSRVSLSHGLGYDFCSASNEAAGIYSGIQAREASMSGYPGRNALCLIVPIPQMPGS